MLCTAFVTHRLKESLDLVFAFKQAIDGLSDLAHFIPQNDAVRKGPVSTTFIGVGPFRYLEGST
jgi:hypothetical protein